MKVDLLEALRALAQTNADCPTCRSALALLELAKEEKPEQAPPKRRRSPKIRIPDKPSEHQKKIYECLREKPLTMERLGKKFYPDGRKLIGPLVKGVKTMEKAGWVTESDGFWRITEEGAKIFGAPPVVPVPWAIPPEHWEGRVKNVLSKMRLPPFVHWEELVSAGMVGLCEALRRYDPSLGKVWTYAQRRVKGAILDELRRRDPAPRLLRTRLKEAKSSRRPRPELESTLEEFNEYLRSEKKYEKLRHELSLRNPVSLDVPIGNEEDAVLGDLVPAAPTTPELDLGIFEGLLKQIPEREAYVFTRYFYHRLKMREIAEELGVSESRVSQLRAQAVEKLARLLNPAGKTSL